MMQRSCGSHSAGMWKPRDTGVAACTSLEGELAVAGGMLGSFLRSGRAGDGSACRPPCISVKVCLLYDQSKHGRKSASLRGDPDGGADACGSGQGRRHLADGDAHPRRRKAHSLGERLFEANPAGDRGGIREYRALVAYYFGSKQGLVDALIDSLMEAEDQTLRERLEEIEEPESASGR